MTALKLDQPFTFNFPQVDIHEMLLSDLLHQISKGSFKDHLVEWVHDCLVFKEGETRANEIMDDIDQQYAVCLTSWLSAHSGIAELQQCHCFQGLEDFHRVDTSSNGQVMTPRL